MMTDRKSTLETGSGPPAAPLAVKKTRTWMPIVLLTTSALALGGCKTSLRTYPDRIAPTGYNEALKGVTYALPMQQYSIDVTRRLARCGSELKFKPIINGKESADAIATGYWLPSLSFAMSATAEGKIVEGERYLINYEKLNSWTKTTNFEIGYFSGTNILKSINVSVEDQSADIIGSVAAAGLAVAGIALGPAGAGATAALIAAAPPLADKAKADAPVPDPAMQLLQSVLNKAVIQGGVIECAPEVATQVDARSTLATTLKGLQLGSVTGVWADLVGKNSAGKLNEPLPIAEPVTLPVINARIAALLPLIAIKSKSDDVTKTLPALLRWQSAVLAQIASTEAKIADADGKLGAVESTRWPGHFSNRNAQLIAPLSADNLTKLAGMVGPSLTFTADPISGRKYVDEHLIAKELERLATRTTAADGAAFDVLRQKFGAFVALYLHPDNTIRTMPKKHDGCIGVKKAGDLIFPDENNCLSSSLGVAADFEELVVDAPGGIEVLSDRGTWKETAKFGAQFFETVDARDTLPDKGLFVRPGVERILLLCSVDGPVKGGTTPVCAKPRTNLVKDAIIYVPQEGQLRLLPFKNDIFANNGMIVELGQDGRIQKFTYANKKAIAAAGTAAIADAAKQASAFDTARREQARLSAKNEAEKLQGQITAIETARSLARQQDPTSSALLAQQADDNAEAAQRQAERLNIIATLCLAAAKDPDYVPTTCPAI
jgi:hypothetical protein